MTSHHPHVDAPERSDCAPETGQPARPSHSHGNGSDHWLRRALRRLWHSHHHEHGTDTTSADDALETSAEGLRVVKISLVALAITAMLQVVIAAVSGSVALWADTIHNVSDALTAVPLGFAFVLARRRPTRRFTYGYGRAEDVAGLVIVVVIAVSAVAIAWESLNRFFAPQAVEHAGWVAVAGVVGFAGNELVALHRIRVGRRIGSAALVADGLHARADGLTSLAVVGAALGSAAGWRLADPVIGVAISVVVVHLLWVAARDVFRRLVDSVDPALVDRIGATLAATPGIRSIDRVRVRWIGHRLHTDADVVLDAGLSLAEAHAVLEDARHSLFHHVPHLADALLHASPTDQDGDPHAVTRHHFAGAGSAP